MMRVGIIGGRIGYEILRRVDNYAAKRDYCSGSAYENRSKVEAHFGPQIWSELAGKVVVDFGCGTGGEAIEIAQHRAQKVIGIDIRQDFLDVARLAAEKAGVADRCFFSTQIGVKADTILSIDAFDHYESPEQILRVMRTFIEDHGRVYISFGPPWFHPLGGHLFSVFPWAHLIFTEKALIRWRSDFKSDGATRFCEVEGGLNQMTVSRFRKLLHKSEFEIESFEAIPIERLRLLSNFLTREFFTSVVRCKLIPRIPASRHAF